MNSALRIGIVFRPQLPPERLRAFVQAAERAGLDDVWLWEDCFLEGGVSAATAALAWTDTIRVGVGLLPVPLRNPALAAMEIATMARLFPNRFVPAAGHGVLDWMAQVGAGADSPMTLLREWVAAVRALLHAETVTVSGRYVNLDQVALDWPPAAPPPLLVGARGPKTLAMAGALADGLVLDRSVTAAGVATAIQAAAATRPQEVVVYVAFTGGPDEVAATISEYAAAGATTVVLQPDGDDPDMEARIAVAADARTRLRADQTEKSPAPTTREY